MRIAVVSKSDVRGGGASVVATNLTNQYKKIGCEADHFHLFAEEEFHPYGENKALVSSLKFGERIFGYREHLGFENRICRSLKYVNDYDVVHLHDMSSVYSHRYISWLSHQVPTFWTLHDCSPFTAGCLYPGDCDKFENSCGGCPQLGGWPLDVRIDKTHQMLVRRVEELKRSKIKFTAPSRWMINEFRRSKCGNVPISFVPNGIDTDIFYYKEKSRLREKYGLSSHKGPFVLFSAAWLGDTRKGADLAANLLKSITDLKPKVLLVGRYSEQAAELFKDFDVVHFGFVKNEAEKSDYFALADVALMLSDQENAPLTVLEAQACGTAVFGHDAGGVPELLVDASYKYLRPKCEIDQLSSELRKFLTIEDAERAKRISKMTIERFDYRRVAKLYLEMFERAPKERSI